MFPGTDGVLGEREFLDKLCNESVQPGHLENSSCIQPIHTHWMHSDCFLSMKFFSRTFSLKSFKLKKKMYKKAILATISGPVLDLGCKWFVYEEEVHIQTLEWSCRIPYALLF